MLVDALIDAVSDTLSCFPFLLATYLFMEWLEHGAGEKFSQSIAKGGRVGPIIGALLGVIPQCGFSSAAATLYAGRVVTLGTLLAVFLATSDEMIPIMVSEQVDLLLVMKILAIKVVAGIVFGLLLDALLARAGRLHIGLSSARLHEGHEGNDIHVLCEQDGCACEMDERDAAAEELKELEELEGEQGHSHGTGALHGIVLPALKHSLNVTVFIFIITFIINLLISAGLEGALASITATPYLSSVLVGIVAFIPNCAVSVGITELYLDGVMGGGAMIAGLCVNAGLGLLLLFRTNRDANENLRIMGVLLLCGVLVGWVVELLGIL
jgi:hypothetical protein